MLRFPKALTDFNEPHSGTTDTGVPLLDAFNQQNVNFAINTVDPRVDHTISRPGAPWKYDPARVVTTSWSRNIPLYGTYNSMKENVSPDCDCLSILLRSSATQKQES